jgi:hypothetical protein
MYGEEKSDSLIVAAKQANNPKGAESVERRSGAKGNAEQPHMRRTQSRESMSQRLSRVREAAKQRKKERFTALFHLLTVEALEAAFLSLSRKAAAGVDGIRWMDYAGNMKNNITDLHRRLHQGSYRAQPGRRHYIPKADGKQRPLGIASLEDKIVQYALVKILNAVYENDFMGFSYGFRPGRSQHDALDALATGLVRTNVNWVLDADISQFFDRVSHEWLIRLTEHRLGDRRVICSYVSGSQPGRRRRAMASNGGRLPTAVRSSHRLRGKHDRGPQRLRSNGRMWATGYDNAM